MLSSEDSNVNKQSTVHPTEPIQTHTDIAWTSSNIQEYYLAEKQKELTGDPYNSGVDNDTVNFGSLQCQQYYVGEYEGYLDNPPKNETPSGAPLIFPDPPTPRGGGGIPPK